MGEERNTERNASRLIVSTAVPTRESLSCRGGGDRTVVTVAKIASLYGFGSRPIFQVPTPNRHNGATEAPRTNLWPVR